MRRDEIDVRLLAEMTDAEREELDRLLAADPVLWRPLSGPQTDALNSPADIVGFGGAAGGGKTDLACGLALEHHRKSIVFRAVGTELFAVAERLTALIGTAGKRNRIDNVFRVRRPRDGADVTIELGSFTDPGDELKYQGRDHDLIVGDEASNMREHQFRFVLGWLRSTFEGQRKRALLCFNPPTSVEGRWIVAFFGPWLDARHPNPAMPGELRWFVTTSNRDVEVAGPRPVVLIDDVPAYDFDASKFEPADILQPMSRTFIPSRIEDNPFLMGTGYMTVLQSFPEPLRSQMLKGDFRAGMKDDPQQAIPTEWVEIAMRRWKKPDVLPPMDSLGVDVALGGDDEHIIMRRHGLWFDEPLVTPGREITDGRVSAMRILSARRDDAVIHLDLFGVGARPYGVLKEMRMQVVGVNVGEPPIGVDETGRLRFVNIRSELWWRMREALDPTKNNGIALPPSRKLLGDLCSATWSMRSGKLLVLSSDEIKKKIGRSPDHASALVLALIDTPKYAQVLDIVGRPRRDIGGAPGVSYDPLTFLDRDT